MSILIISIQFSPLGKFNLKKDMPTRGTHRLADSKVKLGTNKNTKCSPMINEH